MIAFMTKILVSPVEYKNSKSSPDFWYNDLERIKKLLDFLQYATEDYVSEHGGSYNNSITRTKGTI